MIPELGWKVHIDDNLASGLSSIYIYREGEGPNQRPERIFITNLSTMEVHTVQHGSRIDHLRPTIKLEWGASRNILQALVNGLFNHGIRPKAEPILANELTAVKDHLQDMREIVAHTMKLETPKTKGLSSEEVSK